MMIRKMMRTAALALLGGTMVLLMAVAPLAQTANAAAHHERHEQPEVTTRSYDMDEYLDMLLATGQYAKYERFVQIASPEAYAKHLTWYNGWVNGDATDSGTLVYVVINQAANLGFDAGHDTFTLVGNNGHEAWVRVLHGDGRYYVVLQPVADGVWHVAHVDKVQ